MDSNVCLILIYFLAIFATKVSVNGKFISSSVHEYMTRAEATLFLANITTQSASSLEKSVYGLAKPKFGVKTAVLTFQTIHGQQSYNETALLAVPDEGASGQFPTIIYNHKDLADSSLLPSNSQLCSTYTAVCAENMPCCNILTSYAALASFWAMQGFIVLMPDYFGNGRYGRNQAKVPAAYQKELYSKSILAALQAIKDGQTAIFSSGVQQSTQVLMAGFSEGAYASLALQKELDPISSGALKDFNLLATFAHAVPYNFKAYVKDTMKKFASNTAGTENIYNDMWRGPRIMMSGIENGQDAYALDSCFDMSASSPASEFRTKLIQEECCMGIQQDPLKSIFSDASAFFSNAEVIDALKNGVWSKELEEAIITRNELRVDWKPRGKTYLCSASNNLVVDEKYSEEAFNAYLNAAGQNKVVWDRFVGKDNPHQEAEASCLLVLNSILSKTDWTKEEDEFLHGIKLVKDQALSNDLSIWAIIGISFGSLIVLIAISCFGYEKSTGKKCPSICEVWVAVLSKCAILVLIGGFAFSIGVSAAGAYMSNWKIVVDSDFAGYMSAESALKAELDMFGVAQREQMETVQTAATTKKRRLQAVTSTKPTPRNLATTTTRQSRTLWRLDIFYEVKSSDPTHGIFHEKALEEIKGFENKLKEFTGYNDYCLKKHFDPGKTCDLPMSIINVMYGKTDTNGTQAVSSYDGKGVLQDIKTVLKTLATEGALWYTDASFGPSNLTSQFTRSQFRGGLPLKGYKSVKAGFATQTQKHQEWMKSLYNFLLEESQKSEHVTISWYEPWFLRDFEVQEQLYHDALFSLGSFAFVAGFVMLHLESLFLSTVAMASIILSFPMAYFVFYVIAGVKTMMLLNFVSLFLIMGIGADDVFVMFDTYHQSRAALDKPGKPSTVKSRMLWTYKEAGGAMLITTVTTVGSFYSNCLSTVRVVKEFGLYMGSVVVFNFINVMILFPAAIIVHEHTCGKLKCMSRIKNMCCRRKMDTAVVPLASPGTKRRKRKRTKSRLKQATTMRRTKITGSLDPKKLNAVEKLFYGGFSTCLSKGRFVIIILSFGLAITSGVMAVFSFKASSGPPVVFKEEHNLGRIEELLRTAFSATSMEDMEKAADAFPADKVIVKQTCPGKKDDMFCNGHGKCDAKTLLCSCDEDFVGLDCKEPKKAGSVSVSTTQLEWSFLQTNSNGEEKSFTLSNIGDSDVKWSMKFKSQKPTWVASTVPEFSHVNIANGQIAKRNWGSSGATNGQEAIKIVVNSGSLLESESDTTTLEITSPDEDGKVYEVLLRVSMMSLTPKLLGDKAIFQKVNENGVKTTLATTSLNLLEYRYEKITVGTTKENADDTVQLIVNNIPTDLSTVDLPVDINNDQSIKTTVVINVTRVTLGISRTTSYEYQFIRSPANKPSRPTITTVQATAVSELTVSLSAPSQDGGSDISVYNCSTTPDNIFGSASDTTVVIKNLDPAKAYQVGCFAKNKGGALSLQSIKKPEQENDYIFANVDTKPVIDGPPTAEKISNTEVHITSLEFNVGGAPLKEVICSSNPGNFEGRSSSRISSDQPLSITGLDVDGSGGYTFTCIVENDIGIKSDSSSISAEIKAGQPGPPSFNHNAADKEVIVSGLLPPSNDIARNYSCKLEYGNDKKIEKASSNDNGVPSTTISFKGLTNGVEYRLRCSCENSVGFGAYTDAVTVTPYGKPYGTIGIPRVIESGNGEIRVRVSPLPEDNGDALTKVLCISTPGDKEGNILNPTGDNAEIIIQELDKSLMYTIKCQAINRAGAGNFSGASNSSQPSSEPSKVRNMVLAHNNSGNSIGLKVTYDQPEDSGGYSTLTYICECCTSDICKNSSTTELETTFDNLAEGETYQVTCRVKNDVGESSVEMQTMIAGRKPTDTQNIAVTASAKGRVTIKLSSTIYQSSGGLTTTKYLCKAKDAEETDGLEIEKSPGDFPIVYPPPSIPALNTSVSYRFACRLKNSAGNGEYGSFTSPIRPIIPPGKPSFDQNGIRRMNKACTMKLTEPSDDGGDSIVRCRCVSIDPPFVSESMEASSPYEWNITGLNNGVGYQFRCACTNSYLLGVAYGENTSTFSRTCTPKDPPGPTVPTNIIPLASPNQIAVSFGAPVDPGKSDVLYYECGAYLTGTIFGGTFSGNTSGVGTITIPGLTNGQNYSVVCRAVNSDGGGDLSNAVYSVPSDVPNSCGKSVDIIVSKGALTVTVVKPAFDGGDRIQGFKCKASATNKASRTGEVNKGPDNLDVTITGLENGVDYAVACQAKNSAGYGNLGPLSDVFAPEGKPDPPSITIVARNGSGSIKTIFNPPVDNGGRLISNYTCVAAGTVNRVTVSSAIPIILSGLVNGNTYKVKCKCSNVHGDSVEAESVEIIPADVPARIPAISVLQTARSAFEVSVTKPDSNGDAISKYICSAKAESTNGTNFTGGSVLIGRSTTTTVTIMSPIELRAASEIKVSCQAENAVGKGPDSSASTLFVENLPPAPLVSIKPGNGFVVVRANATDPIGNMAIDGIHCRLYRDDNRAVMSGEISQMRAYFDYTWSSDTQFGIENGKIYVARCYASKSIGNGILSSFSSPVRAGVTVETTLSITLNGNGLATNQNTVKQALGQALVPQLVPSEAAIYINSYTRSSVNSQQTATISFNTMMESANQFTEIREKIFGLPFDSIFLSSIDSASAEVTNPILYSVGYERSNLARLSLMINTQNVLIADINTDITSYEINVTRSQFSKSVEILATPDESHASMSLTKYSTIGSAGPYTTSNTIALRDVSVFDGKTTDVYVRVYSAKCKDTGDTASCTSDMYTQYLVKIGREPLACPACVNADYCDPFIKGNNNKGICTCPTTEYKGELCDVYCPQNNGKECNGKGVCDTDVKQCVCSSTYTGVGCVQRECPVCNSTGITEGMLEMIQTGNCAGSDYKCECKKGYTGDACETKTCYQNCYSQGKCSSGVCECYDGYKGEFCQTKLPRKIPLIYAVEISLVYGIKNAASSNKTKPVYSTDVDFARADAQAYLLSVCNEAINSTQFNLHVREDYPCWISAFKEGMLASGQVFPASKTLFPYLIDSFFASDKKLSIYKKDIGTKGKNYDGKIQYTSLTFKINVDASIGASALLPYYNEWKKFVEHLNSNPPSHIGPVRMISSVWTKMDTELGIITSTVTSYLSSNAICLICVIIFTGDLLISLYAMLAILMIVTTLMGFLFAVLGYTFGAIEAVGVTIFVGMSVDYALHMAHGYHSAHGSTRFEKVRDALTHLGISIIGGAVTTAGAAVFLFFCHMYLFVQLGTMMFMNTVLALFYSLIFLTAMLRVAGPMSSMFDVYAVLGFFKRSIRRALQKKPTSMVVVPSVEEPNKNDAESSEASQTRTGEVTDAKKENKEVSRKISSKPVEDDDDFV